MLKPECVVETGIANGISPASLPEGKDAGWFALKWLRKRWHVQVGDAKEILPKLLPELGRIDIFLHDSLHTYEHMLWEFEIAYPSSTLGRTPICGRRPLEFGV